MTLKTESGLDGEYVPSPVARVRKQVADKNPSWYTNLVTHPRVRLQDGATVKDFHAREVSGEEKQRYWTIAEQFWPHFPEYRRLAAGRDIPIMVLEPIASS
jgi:F420H(2)-dependent quinone reductase